MKITVFTKDLEAAIKKIDLVRPNKHKLKVLENIRLVADDNNVRLITTDLENSIEIKLDADIQEVGSIVLGNIANIKKSFKFFKDYKTTIMTNNKEVFFINGTKEIKNDTITDEFPELPQLKDESTYTYNTLSFVNRIKKVSPATAKDETRPILTGIHFNNSDMVAVDGYRIHINKDHNLEINNKFTAQGKTLEIFTKLISKKDDYNLKISVDEKYVKLNYDNVTLTGRLLEGEFINHNQVIPRDYRTKVTLNKEELQENIEFLGTYDKLIRFEMSQSEIVSIANNETGIYKANTSPLNFEGENITIAANKQYLTDALKCIDDENISIEMTTHQSPIIFKNDRELYLVLPVRLSA